MLKQIRWRETVMQRWMTRSAVVLVLAMVLPACGEEMKQTSPVGETLSRVRAHDFERNSGYVGVGDLSDDAWRVRTLAVRDLVRLGPEGVPAMLKGLRDPNRHVRHVCVTALGILSVREAGAELAKLLENDPDPVVRGQAAQALGETGYEKAMPVLEAAREHDNSEHVRHRAELAIARTREEATASADTVTAWASLDEKDFRQLAVGRSAPDFELRDTAGKLWRLSDFRGKKTVALIWIFADWCPVCHSEFHELTELEDEFREADVQPFTIECHDLHRSKAMVGEREIWWPHLVDVAGKVGALYGVDPMEFVVHDEWINRPSTIIVDRQGVVRFAYYGTYWGDRPTIEQTLDMIKTGSYSFRHPERRD